MVVVVLFILGLVAGLFAGRIWLLRIERASYRRPE
jgi:hypothetical protein